ncbi:MAG: hypothetical protein MK098_11405 [Marinovum sp.]|nr:hypothetical protein [Marinovum sp.]
MKTLSAALIALTVTTAPALAYGPVLTLPALQFPTEDAVVSSQTLIPVTPEAAK